MAEPKIQFAARFPPPLYERLTRHAEVTGVSRNALIVQATADMLDELEEVSGDAPGKDSGGRA